MEKTPWNPSRKATARVKDPLPVPENCPYCEGPVETLHHKKIYGTAYSDWPWVYACTSCDARVGMHPFTAIPLGTLADADTREARKISKRKFKEFMRKGSYDRNEAYELLAAELGMSRGECHFGWFTESDCEESLEALDSLMASM